MSLQFEPVWSWLFAIAVFAAVLSVIRIAYPRRIQHLSSGARNSLIALRVLIAVVLFLMTLRPVVLLESDDQSNAIMYLLCDASKSMNTEDIPEGGTRRQALQKLKEAADASFEAIGKKAEIRIRDFSDSIQTTATVGLFLSLIVILTLRLGMSAQDFADYGWRIPFLVSVLLLALSVWIRLSMEESPAFRKMKAEGRTSKAPLSESFGQWRNLRGEIQSTPTWHLGLGYAFGAAGH